MSDKYKLKFNSVYEVVDNSHFAVVQEDVVSTLNNQANKIKGLEAQLEKAWVVINEAGYEGSDIQLKEFMEKENCT